MLRAVLRATSTYYIKKFSSFFSICHVLFQKWISKRQIFENGDSSMDQSLAGNRSPPYLYLHLDDNYGFHDKLFFCEYVAIPARCAMAGHETCTLYHPCFSSQLSKMNSAGCFLIRTLSSITWALSFPSDKWCLVFGYKMLLVLPGQSRKRVEIQIRVYETKDISKETVHSQTFWTRSSI